MRQQINLYGPSLMGTRIWVSGSKILLAAVAALVLLSLFAVFQEWRLGQVRAEADRLQAQVTEQGRTVETRSAALAARSPGEALQRQVERLEREAAGKRALLERLSGDSLGNTAGFSAHLAGLGRHHPDGLWLQRVSLAAGGRRLGLEGSVTRAELLPRYLNALSRESAFAGTNFDTFSLHRSEDASGPMQFRLATPCYDGQGERLPAERCLQDQHRAVNP
jgi:hypothetical protein